jgi:hypothetical protein
MPAAVSLIIWQSALIYQIKNNRGVYLFILSHVRRRFAHYSAVALIYQIKNNRGVYLFIPNYIRRRCAHFSATALCRKKTHGRKRYKGNIIAARFPVRRRYVPINQTVRRIL